MNIMKVTESLFIELESRGKGSGETIELKPADPISLDPCGVEFYDSSSGRRRFIPWSGVREIWQPAS